MVEAIRGHDYDKPYTAMKDYLDRMDSSMFIAAQPTAPPQRVLAALRPRMLRLAAEKAERRAAVLRASRTHRLRARDAG